MNDDSASKKLTPEQLDRMRGFISQRDRHANLLGQATIAFEKQKAFHAQQIELLNHEEQQYIAEIARVHGIDVNKPYTIDYKTGELIEK